MPISLLNKIPPLAVTMGEPAGIGPELLLKLFAEKNRPLFVGIGDYNYLQQLNQRFKLPLNLTQTTPETLHQLSDDACGVIHVPLNKPVVFGQLNPLNATAVVDSLQMSVRLIQEQIISGVVTLPIHKANLYAMDFPFKGHTEFFGYHSKRQFPMMVMWHEQLKVYCLTTHIALSEVFNWVTKDNIIHHVRQLNQELTYYLGKPPKLAIAGLNPHAGEGGAMGTEEITAITPAVLQLQQEGVWIEGPFASDSLFSPFSINNYDCFVTLYHDQGLIPIKTLYFDTAVNVTLGLDYVRTSPDHGTALDLAGTFKANPTSSHKALMLAYQLAYQRALNA